MPKKIRTSRDVARAETPRGPCRNSPHYKDNSPLPGNHICVLVTRAKPMANFMSPHLSPPIYALTLTDPPLMETAFRTADIFITTCTAAVVALLPHISKLIIVAQPFAPVNCNLAVWSLLECNLEQI